MKKRGGKFFHLVLFLILFFTADFFILPKNCSSSTGELVINEIMTGQKNNSKNEFIRLYNSSDSSINLEKYKLTKKTKKGIESNLISAAKFLGIIPARGYFTISHPNYMRDFGADLAYSGNSYSISDDNTVILYDKDNNIIDKVGFGEASDFEEKATANPPEDKSIVRKKSGEDSDNNFDDFKLKEEEKTKPKEYSKEIRINEILPKPAKGEKEFIEIHNPQKEDLGDLKLEDRSGKECQIPKEIAKREFIVLWDCGIKLNDNSGEKLVLYNADAPDALISFVEYKNSAKENISYSFDGIGWKWSSQLTPGEENKFDEALGAVIKKDEIIYKNIYASFEAKMKNKNQKVVWDFGDGHKSYLRKTKHKYLETGTYQASLKIEGKSEDFVENFSVEVKKFGKSEIRIVGVKANPKGKDGKETITLKNSSKKKINLKNWSIATGWKNLYNHPISKKLVLKPGETKEITKKYSAFALNNKQTKIEIRRPDGSVAAKVKYSKKEGIEDDETYEKTDSGWQWNGVQTNTDSTRTIAEDTQTSPNEINNDNNIQDNQEVNNTEMQDDEPVENGEVLGAETISGNGVDNNRNENGLFVAVLLNANQAINNLINFFF